MAKEYFVVFGMDGKPIGMPRFVKDEIDVDAALEWVNWAIEELHTQGLYTKEWLLEQGHFCESDFKED